jgi:Ca-activated chloride channel family protein
MGNLRQAGLTSGGDRDLMLLGVQANGAVKGRLLVMTLQQFYRNTSPKNTEITYTFPLPLGAVLMEVEVELNGQVLKGEVSPRSSARVRYEEALSEGNSSIMLERNPDGSFTLELGNLMAREECRILIRYAQVLVTEHGQVRLMLPTTIAPRYGNPITQGRLQPHQVPVTDLTAEYPFDISVTLMGEMANTNVGSPSHKTSYSRNKDDLVIKLSQRGYLDRDFILVINKLKNDSDAMVCQDLYAAGQSAVMAFFSPKIPSNLAQTITAKVLVDCSSSMSGDSIEAARRALMGIVENLGKDDKFSLSRFGSSFEHRSRGMWSGTPQAKASARRWIDSLQANLGGTEMAAALVSTIAIGNKRQSDILLITDGEIEGIDEVIDVACKSKHRVFIVAIGASPAEVHLRRLAAATGGLCDFVAPGEDVEPAVLRMSARMRSARATDIRVEWPQSLTMHWEQMVQTYAFEDDAFNVCAFVATPPAMSEPCMVKLWGRIDGQPNEVLMAQAALTPTETSTNSVARLAAHARYLELHRARQKLGASPTLCAAQELAVAYKLVTDETNFILVHERSEAEKAQEMPNAHKVPQMLAAGWGGTGSVVQSLTASIGSRIGALADMALDNEMMSCVSDIPRLDRISPSVWRTVDASSTRRSRASGFDDMDDDFEIPAFLRKQIDAEESEPAYASNVRRGIDKRNALLWVPKVTAHGHRRVNLKDDLYEGITPAGLEHWTTLNHESLWPKTYAELRDLGLGLSICEWLEFEIGVDRNEHQVITIFLKVLREYGLHRSSGVQKVVQTIQKAMQGTHNELVDGDIADEIRRGLSGITAQAWPRAVVDFPEVEAA